MDATVEPDPEITGLTADSRAVEPGFLFAAMPGAKLDGRAFVGDAVSRGALAVLVPAASDLPSLTAPDGAPVAVIADGTPRRRLARLAATFYDAQPETIVAVTGTNGKTSVVHFLHQLWERTGERAASLGTLGLRAAGFEAGPNLTTPDPVDLHRRLAALKQAGIERLAMEASSHGLDQYRLDGVRLRAAAFTTFSRDHLDYHRNGDAYLAAKLRLFAEVMAAGGTAVLNAELPPATLAAVRKLAGEHGHRVTLYGSGAADVRLQSRTPMPDGQDIEISVFGRRHWVRLPLIGVFQAQNLLCALALAVACGTGEDDAVAALPHLTGAPGRMQHIATLESGAAVYIDYAHTPDALSHILRALRAHCQGRLWVVFGAGGDRDSGKRPEMGAAARELADVAIVTDDNPRSEDAAAIRARILAACPDGREIGDRAEAIRTAVSALSAGDLLVIAGKGHETGQIVGDRTIPFDDAAEARAAVAELEGRA
ncbi:MAG: UDP-N-acetylmuramoyl-L-alanyl-D-glutamate--2,6-diaminopimelate ligase [Acetobacterales bacterium]